jgi:hypothetical protein
MQDEPNFEHPGMWPGDVEQLVLRLLLEQSTVRLWSLDELILEIGDPPAVLNALAALQGAGLVHRTTEGFAFATRAAARCSELIGHL